LAQAGAGLAIEADRRPGASLLYSLVKAVGKIRTIPAFLAATKDLGEVLCLEAPSFSSR